VHVLNDGGDVTRHRVRQLGAVVVCVLEQRPKNENALATAWALLGCVYPFHARAYVFELAIATFWRSHHAE